MLFWTMVAAKGGWISSCPTGRRPKPSASNMMNIFIAAHFPIKSALSGSEFVLTRAEEYKVPVAVNRCYFFNPFSVEILHKVMARILESYYENPREIFLFFYYPSDDYIAYLMTVKELEFYDEISCEDLFDGKDTRERILIFQLPDYRT